MTPFSTCHCSTSETTEKGKQTPVGLAALSKFCLVKIEHNSISLEVPLASIETTRTSLRLQAGVSLSCILSCLTILVGSLWLCSEVQSAWSALWVLFQVIISLLVTWEQQHSFHPQVNSALLYGDWKVCLWFSVFLQLIHQYSSNDTLPFITP